MIALGLALELGLALYKGGPRVIARGRQLNGMTGCWGGMIMTSLAAGEV
jgi:hypothetical protein